jgi:hypothetical protein
VSVQLADGPAVSFHTVCFELWRTRALVVDPVVVNQIRIPFVHYPSGTTDTGSPKWPEPGVTGAADAGV